MYPLILEGIKKEKVWGGSHLYEFGKCKKEEVIGESWEVACHKNGMSVIKNGKYKGTTLNEVIETNKNLIVNNSSVKFPLLIKYIDANNNLSLQVHPDDEYSHSINEPYGKSEAWYILSAEENAEIILGSRDISKEELLKHIDDDSEIDYINHVKVKAGELYFIPSGTIHGIGKGIVLLEIQQNCDLTYRIFDYFRNRELQKEEAKKVVKLNSKFRKCIGIKEVTKDYIKTEFINIKEFTIEKIEIFKEFEENNIIHDFHIINCIEGEGKIIHEEGETEIKKGISLLIPAKMGTYKIVGVNTVIRTYV